MGQQGTHRENNTKIEMHRLYFNYRNLKSNFKYLKKVSTWKC